ncbi:MAG: hypothetical protein EOO14_21575 [Chitinophagaceae bacterium]|nr:MAG: hypothetical protein EOO14_21575 [Chitinophagaceae bacterium]
MLHFKAGEIPGYNFQQAAKKPIPIRCFQLQEPFEIETMEGLMQGKAGDYLIVGIKGEMYPCDRAIFEETYDILK